MIQPQFITIEGGEGVGKSTQQRLLAETLGNMGITSCITREPGGTVGAEQIRAVIKSGEADKFDPVSEALLFFAGRRDHIEKVIKPALAAGQWVICDRFVDSTYVYQCLAGTMPIKLFIDLNRVAIDNMLPNLTIVLDLDSEEALFRSKDLGVGDSGDGSGDSARFERKGREFHRRVREGYRQLVAENPSRCILVDASGAIEDVQARIWRTVRERYGFEG